MKVLDVSSLHEGIRGMTQQLSQLEKQLNGVENSIRSFVASKDSFRGQGANAIRRFYEYAHLPFLQFFQSFLTNFQSKLQQLQFEMDGLEGDSRGFIDEAFLSSELENGLNQINRMVAERTGEMNAQLSRVSDIVYLPRLQDHQLQEGIQQAKQSARQTVDKLHQFDHQQTQSFTALVEDLSLIKRYIEEMNQQFESGKINVKSFSPVMLQDLEAYGNLQTRLYNQTVMERWNSQHYPELGVFYSVGHAASFDQWVNPSCARPEPKEKSVLESLSDFSLGFGEGLTNFIGETAEGIVRLVTQPHVVIKETWEFVNEVAENPVIIIAIVNELYHSFNSQVIHGDADSRGEWCGYAVPAVGSILVGGSGAVKGAGKAIQIGRRAEIDLKMSLSEIHTSAVSAAAKATGKMGMDRVRELMKNLTPRRDTEPVPIMAGDVPFNVFNGQGIKNSLTDMHSKILTRIETVAGKNLGRRNKNVETIRNSKHFIDEFTLKPNVKYETNGYQYKTDNLGRIERASGELKLEMGMRDSHHQLAAGGIDRVIASGTKGDHGGHLIGTQFNGSPLIDNIVAMNGNVNVSAYKKLEYTWAKALKEGQEVLVDIKPIYEGTSLRPSRFEIKFKIDGRKSVQVLENIYGGH
ncbi:T7SS effector LXG polymorphic toxin [Sutcliffiella horikoshii]